MLFLRTRIALLTTVALGLSAAAACGGSSSSDPTGDGGAAADGAIGADGATGDGGTNADGTNGSDGGAAGFTTVFTILLENHDYSEVVGSPNAPYINSLIAQGGLATKYDDSLVHPSLPNYLYMISGSVQGISSDILPTQSPFPVAGDNLGNQLQTAGIKWRSYQESMATPCRLTNAGSYATKHDPFLYFSDIQGNGPLCAATNVDYAANFPADLAAGTYKYMWITPNLLDDGHDPTNAPVTGLKQSDAWCMTEVQKILDSAVYKAGGVIFLTWDEAEGRGDSGPDRVPMIILSPKIKSAGFTSAAPYSHASYLATMEDIFALPRLGAAVGKTNMMEFFK